jgi:hypothetical protein
MRNKKVLPILLFLFFLVGSLILPSNRVQAAVGSEEFSVNVVKVEKTVVVEGQAQKITVEIVDKYKQGFEDGFIKYLAGNLGNIFYIPLEKTSEENIYTATVDINKWHLPGQWQPYEVLLYGEEFGSADYYVEENKEIEAGSFMVVGTLGDFDVPQVINVAVDKKVGISGEVIGVKAEISDYDESGVSYVTVDFDSMYDYEDDGLTYYLSVDLFPSTEKDVYEGIIVLDDKLKSGEWTITGVHVGDNVQNYGNLYYNENLDPREFFPNSTFTLAEKKQVLTGWQKQDNKWYYFDATGVKKTGWLLDGDKWYHLGGSGAMTTGWLSDGGNWYYLEGSGIMKTGWLQDGGKWYYLQGNGVMAKNTVIEGCKLGNDGAWIK